jgi:membrane-associated phospholipid phosphatase
VLDPLLAGVAVGFVASMAAGPAMAYGLDRCTDHWRRPSEWLVIAAGLAFGLAAEHLPGAVPGPVVGFVLATLPGLVAFLVSRTVLATAIVSLAPLYFVIGEVTRNQATSVPAMALDRAVPVEPAWMIVYGSLYVFVVVLPLLVIRERELGRSAMRAYLAVMLVSYVGFLLFPTAGPRPAAVADHGFAAWTLRLLYSIDPPHGCFPSLHVAYAFVSASACWRVHRGVGAAAAVWAALIGVSTLYTKQHYVADVIAGALVAGGAYLVFLRRHPRSAAAEGDRREAPLRAACAAGIFAMMVAGFWVAYLLGASG